MQWIKISDPMLWTNICKHVKAICPRFAELPVWCNAFKFESIQLQHNSWIISNPKNPEIEPSGAKKHNKTKTFNSIRLYPWKFATCSFAAKCKESAFSFLCKVNIHKSPNKQLLTVMEPGNPFSYSDSFIKVFLFMRIDML